MHSANSLEETKTGKRSYRKDRDVSSTDGTIDDVSMTDKDGEEYKDCHVFSFETRPPNEEELRAFQLNPHATNQ